MKGILGLLVSTIMMASPTHAQWNQSSDNYSTGGLALGLTTPLQKLHVKGNLRIDGTSGFNHSELTYYRADGVKFASIGQGDLSEANSTFDIHHHNGNDIRFLLNGQERLRITELGRLIQKGNLPNDNSASFVNSSATGYGLYSEGGSGTRYAFHFVNQQGVSIMHGKGNGNVGIGTINPDAKLAVKGTIHSEEVKVDLNVPAPDYVFDEDYPLLSLSEVAAYINMNKHLPEIPSAEAMEEDGINLGEMNLLLLKKVEELTLHLIDQNKRLAELTERMAVLESQTK